MASSPTQVSEFSLPRRLTEINQLLWKAGVLKKPSWRKAGTKIVKYMGHGNGGIVYQLNTGELIKLHASNDRDVNASKDAFHREVSLLRKIKSIVAPLLSGDQPL